MWKVLWKSFDIESDDYTLGKEQRVPNFLKSTSNHKRLQWQRICWHDAKKCHENLEEPLSKWVTSSLFVWVYNKINWYFTRALENCRTTGWKAICINDQRETLNFFTNPYQKEKGSLGTKEKCRLLSVHISQATIIHWGRKTKSHFKNLHTLTASFNQWILNLCIFSQFVLSDGLHSIPKPKSF